MHRRRPVWTSLRIAALVATIVAAAPAGAAWGYIPESRWSATSTGSAGSTGDPITLTWSFIRDAVGIPQEDPSNLISYMDTNFGAGPGGTDYTLRPWFPLFSDSFGRWSALGGINFVYEPNDDGRQLSSVAGLRNVRGDIRIGGAVVDGDGSTLAYANFPNNGDMVIDTGETSFFTNSANNYRAFRNTLMHELGHAFGLGHVESSNSRLLLEPFIDTAFDGPQLDDIRGIQGQYGDPLEKSNGGLGNDTAARATSLGVLEAGGTLAIGQRTASGQTVGATETNFVSIANASDFDFFSFDLPTPVAVTAALTPLGGVFNQGEQGAQQSSFDANARNDLSLALLGADGATSLGSANNGAAGVGEQLADLTLAAGRYFVRVSGAIDLVQLYELQLHATALAPPSADFDVDGDIDGTDFLAWQRNLGISGADVAGDANHDGVVNIADLTVFRQQFAGAANAHGAARTIPEPGALPLGLVAAALACAGRRKGASHFRFRGIETWLQSAACTSHAGQVAG